MKENSDRKKIRLSGFDYSQAGSYFITIGTHNRKYIFGDIQNENIKLNDIGRIIEEWWNKLPEKFLSIKNDEFTVMPNHIHGIIAILDENSESNSGKAALPRILQWFKAMTGNEYSRYVREKRLSVGENRLWQRSYYDHVIRNEKELGRIREYIKNNPLKWHLDRENLESDKLNIDLDKYFADIYE